MLATFSTLGHGMVYEDADLDGEFSNQYLAATCAPKLDLTYRDSGCYVGVNATWLSATLFGFVGLVANVAYRAEAPRPRSNACGGARRRAGFGRGDTNPAS